MRRATCRECLYGTQLETRPECVVLSTLVLLCTTSAHFGKAVPRKRYSSELVETDLRTVRTRTQSKRFHRHAYGTAAKKRSGESLAGSVMSLLLFQPSRAWLYTRVDWCKKFGCSCRRAVCISVFADDRGPHRIQQVQGPRVVRPLPCHAPAGRTKQVIFRAARQHRDTTCVLNCRRLQEPRATSRTYYRLYALPSCMHGGSPLCWRGRI